MLPIGTKPLTEPMLIYYELYPQEQTSVTFEWEYDNMMELIPVVPLEIHISKTLISVPPFKEMHCTQPFALIDLISSDPKYVLSPFHTDFVISFFY